MQSAKSVIKQPRLERPRDIKKVPFVELYNNRLQGVVSSGSDIMRVYVSYFESGTSNYYCSTNNNRPCGGLRGVPCKHLTLLMQEALLQFGAIRVINYLGLDLDPQKVETHYELIQAVKGGAHKQDASMVFSRFLNYLQYVNLPTSNQPVPEIAWFVQ